MVISLMLTFRNRKRERERERERDIYIYIYRVIEVSKDQQPTRARREPATELGQ